jgi:trimeric autotransporter adhesin
MANTNILIKRSSSTGRPSSLAAGELAYSYQSNTLFLGTAAGNGAINVGGIYYTQAIDNATNSATPDTLVKRDATGNASFNYITANIIGTIQGTANAALQLENSRNFSISGGDITASAIGFNGTGDVTLVASLDAVPGLTAASYGSATEIPTIEVAANGRVMSITTTAISTEFTIEDDDLSQANIAGGSILALLGGEGITSNISGGDTITFSVDDTVVRSNTAITSQTIDGNITIAGNLTVQGVQTVVNTTTLNVVDPLIILASNNTTDAVDIGFAGHYTDGDDVARHTGIFRDAGTKEYYVFDGYQPELANNTIDVADGSFNLANLNVGIVRSEGLVVSDGANTTSITPEYISATTINISNDGLGPTTGLFACTAVIHSLTTYNAIDYADYNVGNTLYHLIAANATQNTDIGHANTKAQAAFDKANGAVIASSNFTFGQMVVADGDDSLKSLANVSYTLTGTLDAANTITSLSVDAYGRVTAATGAAIAIDAQQITSGTLGYSRGGTGSTSYTTGALLVAGVNGLESLSNTTYTATGTGAANNTVSSLTVDSYGRVTAATFSAISGLTVGQGGTGRSTFTTNGIIYGNSTDGQLVTAAAGTSDQTWSNQILTVTNAGVPVWSTALDGGTF